MEQNHKESELWSNRKKIELIREEEKIIILLNGQKYMMWDGADKSTPKVAIVEIHELGLAKKEEIASAFDINIKTVYNYITAFKLKGIAGLIEEEKGPKESWKIIPEIRGKILLIYLGEKITNLIGIQKRLIENFNTKICIESIRKVLIENGFIKDVLESDELEEPELFQIKTYEQSELEFCGEKDNEDIIQIADEIKETEIKSCEEDKKNLSEYSQAQRIYLDRIEKSSKEIRQERGDYNAYSGGLLFAPLLKRYKFCETIKKIIDIKTLNGYSLEELCLTIFFMDVFGYNSIENYKTVYSEEFGVLIGKLNSPSVYTLRRFLKKVKELKSSEKLIEECGKLYLKEGLIKWRVGYADGHFDPYQGMQKIAMGWHTVRNKPMKGGENFILTDEEFNPIIFMIRPSTYDLLEILPELIIKAKKIAKELGYDENKLAVLFDREGYSAELFTQFDNKEDDASVIFITWGKYSDKWVNKIEDEKFKDVVKVEYKIQDSKEVKYFDTKRRMKGYGEIRAIVIESGTNKKRIAIYTNDKTTPAGEIIKLICVRWGEENLNKILKLKHYIDYYPGKGWYESDEIEEQPMVENPDVIKLKNKKSLLVSELNKLKIKLSDKMLVKDIEVNWEDIKKERPEILSKIVSLESEIWLIKLKIKELPEEIKYDEAHGGEKLYELDYEKKKFLDCLKMFGYHLQKQMYNIIGKYYDKKKEIWPLIEMIVKRGANIKLDEGKIIVRLKRFRNEEVDFVARRLCDELTAMNPTTLDRFNLPIQYEVM